MKVIKDAAMPRVTAPSGKPAGAVAMRVLDMSMLPFTLYVRIELPPAEQASMPAFLHLLGRPPQQGGPNTLFLAVRIPDPAPAERSDATRRILLLLIGDEIPEGQYRLALVCDRQHLAVVDLARRPDQVSVLTRARIVRPPDPSPVLLSGTHKSGTTWLEKIVDAHPDFIVLHEANTFNIFDQDELRRLVASRQSHFRHKNYIRWLDPAFDVNDFSRFLQVSLARELTLRLGRAWGSRFVADRTPGYTGLYTHLARFWDGLRIVHIVRHPLDVLASRLFHEANLERNSARTADLGGPLLGILNGKIDTGVELASGDFVSDADATGSALQMLLRDWRRDQDHFLAARQTAPDCLHLVRYEDLVANFEIEAARIFSFIGTDPARTNIPYIRQQTSFEALSGGRKAGEVDPRSFFRKGVTGDWRHVFSDRQAGVLWQAVASTAAAFGYSIAEVATPGQPGCLPAPLTGHASAG